MATKTKAKAKEIGQFRVAVLDSLLPLTVAALILGVSVYLGKVDVVFVVAAFVPALVVALGRLSLYGDGSGTPVRRRSR